jgi:putative DNA primase/helicase
MVASEQRLVLGAIGRAQYRALPTQSAEKRSGKTSLLTLIGAISARALPTANISAAAVYRTVELAQPTLLVDESDTFIAENDELRGCLNAGFMRGGQCIRVVGEQNDPRLFSCWSPVAIAAIRRLPDTIEDRAVAIPMKRRRRDEDVEKLRADRLNEFSELAAKARRWADDNFDKLEAADPIMPDALNDRAADCWRILFAIAIEAGGSWRDRAQNAALAFSTENRDVETAATRLLSDLRELFDDQSVLFSEEIVKKLVAMEHRSWAEWGKNGEPMSKVQLARLVGHFGIRPKTVYRDGDKAKGYEREQFDDAFDRYLPPRQRP